MQYHTKLREGDIAPYVLLPGDPKRVSVVAGFWDEAHPVADNREHVTYTGVYRGMPISCTSTGMGCPSTAIAMEELARCGVKNFIRIGTCGGMHLEVRGGDLVVASAAIRMEGLSREYLPVEFPAVADFEVTAALAQAGKAAGIPCHVGVVQCKDSFYGQQDPDSMTIAEQLKGRWAAWLKGGCLASEMESAALFIVSAVRGVRAGCVLQAIWNQERVQAGLPDTRCPSPEAAARTAVQALAALIRQDREKKK